MNEQRWERSHPNARGGFRALAALLLLPLVGCATKAPTEVVVTVFSDLPCESSSVAAVAIGVPGELGDRILSGTSTTCSEDGSRGDIVVVPKGDANAEFAIEARISADPAVGIDDCVAARGYENCIVSRRILSFIPERTVRLRMDLRNPCISTPCDQATTCVAQGTTKSCHEAKIDVSQCSPECDESTVITQNPEPIEVPNPNQPMPMPPGDPCTPNPCDAHGTCKAVADQATCTCKAGYAHPPSDDLACTDIDECSDGGGNDCDPHATCTNTPGSFSCACDEGYAGTDGTSCEQIECNVQCSDLGACVKDATNQFTCKCKAGYTGDGVSCTDIDECKAQTSPCQANAICSNTPGSFKCTCSAGYEANGVACSDIDECANHTANCGVGKQCTNTPGGFDCTDCGAGYTGDGTTCTDIDECSAHTDNCGSLATCVNKPGSFTCQCPMGYTNVSGVCTDVDECATPTACAVDQTCTNTIGGFSCLCTNLVSQVPAMTSNTTPSGVVSSSGDYDTSYAAWQAFDAGGTTSYKGLWVSKQNVTPAVLGYDFSSGTRTVVAYELVFTNGIALAQRGPSVWTFEGSNDAADTGWQTLDQRSGISWTSSTLIQRFQVATPGAYRKYRLYITDDNYSSPGIDVISLGEVRLLACGP